MKVLRENLPETALRRFEREARALARIDHPNLVEVLDAGVSAGRPWLAMEAIEGVDLQTLVRGGERLSPREGARLARDVAGVLDALHAAGLVHRDLKPANLMLSGTRTVVMDLGLVHVAEETQLTRTGLVVGTPMYLPPELYGGGDVTPECDWFALGLSLRTGLLGRHPYTRAEVQQMLLDMRWRAPEPLPASLAETPLGILVEELTREDPAARPGSRADVMAILDGAPRTSPPPVVDESGRFPREGRGAALGGVFLLALLGGLVLAPGTSPPPPPPAPPSPAPAASPATAAPAAPERPPTPTERLRSLADSFGYPDQPSPHAALEVLVREGDHELGAAIARAVEEALPDEAFTAYLAATAARRARRTTLESLSLAGADQLDHWDVHVEMEGIEADYLVAHQEIAAGRARAEALAPPRERARRLDARLAARTDIPARFFRAELWDMLARRADGLAAENLRAYEVTRDLLPEVLAERAVLDPAARLHLVHTAIRAAVRHGGHRDYLALREALSPWALAAIRGEELVRLWTLRLHADGERLVGATGVMGFDDMVQRTSDPTSLPLGPRDPGAGRDVARAARWFLPGRAPPPVLEVVRRDGSPLLEDLRAAAARARVAGVQVRAGRAVVSEAAGLLAGSRDLADELVGWPEVLVAVHDATPPADRRAVRRLLRRAWAATRAGPAAYVRLWFAPPHAAVARRLLDPGPGEREAHLGVAADLLERLGGLAPPWTADELALAAAALRVLAEAGCSPAAAALARLAPARRTHLAAPTLPAWQRREAAAFTARPGSLDPDLCPPELGDLEGLLAPDPG